MASAKNSWAWVSKWHEPLRQTLIPYRGATLTTKRLKVLIRSVPGIGKGEADRTHPSDHCVNMNNKGACDCAKTDRALVRQVRRGHFLVL